MMRIIAVIAAVAVLGACAESEETPTTTLDPIAEEINEHERIEDEVEDEVLEEIND